MNAFLTSPPTLFLGINGLLLGIRFPEGHRPGALECPSGLQDPVERLGEFEAAVGVLPVLDLQDDVVTDLH
ncbi:hypothetical protein [Streptomyces sp. NBC_00690]|uniref:hypothetical protein n=1 Tax=Streptomyces sp. NBC_00690 TaxID=2975808 RepID=UPI002E2C5D51|nr:hypothetical protein [Streptomyces sp. NBC_00690]